MFNKIGVARVITTISLWEKHSEKLVWLPAQMSLTVTPIDEANVIVMNPDKIKARLEKVFVTDELKLTTFFKGICGVYRAKRAYLTALVGYSYRQKTYPISLIWEFVGDRIKKNIVSIAVPDKTTGYTVEVRFSSKELIWYEDIIEGIEEILTDHCKEAFLDVANKIAKYAMSIPTATWCETMIIKGNYVAQMERRLKP